METIDANKIAEKVTNWLIELVEKALKQQDPFMVAMLLHTLRIKFQEKLLSEKPSGIRIDYEGNEFLEGLPPFDNPAFVAMIALRHPFCKINWETGEIKF
jgi:hypothetical protein